MGPGTHTRPEALGEERRARHKTLTMVVSVTEPKLLMKMLHVTLTGGPGKQREASSCHRLWDTCAVWAHGGTAGWPGMWG